MSDVLGTPVRFQQVSFEAFKEQLKKAGMSEAFIDGHAAMMQAKNDGMDNAVPRTEESSSPTSFRQWCEEVLKPAILKTKEEK